MYLSVCVGLRYTDVLALLPTLFTKTSRNAILSSFFLFHGKLDGWILLVEMVMEISEGLLAMWPNNKGIIYVSDHILG